MTVAELIQRLREIEDDEMRVECRNGAGDHSDIDEVRVFEGVAYIDS